MYRIIKTAISKDHKKLYSIYRYKMCVDDVCVRYIETYGISVTNTSECMRVNDIAHDEDTALRFIYEAAERSVSVNNLSKFVSEYDAELKYKIPAEG